MNEFIIMFRESMEAALIVGIIYTLLEKQGLKSQIRQLWLGVGCAIVASVLAGLLLVRVKASIGNASDKKHNRPGPIHTCSDTSEFGWRP